MTTEYLSRQECTEGSQQAQKIQKSINAAVGRKFAQCAAPIRFRPRDVPHADQDWRYGLDLRIEPLEMTTDFREAPAGKIAARLREWAKLLNQAADSLE
ncbi:MAG TPA: hypothetical protein VMR25_04010 [Planctomycetaceae bacterium]|nr:hypothetical protein [Planctomycetaceae bacterium]